MFVALPPYRMENRVNPSNNNSHPLIGMDKLTALAFQGIDLNPTAEKLIKRSHQQQGDAAALMDLATIYFLSHNPELAMQLQAGAIAAQPRYQLASRPLKPEVRVLALMGPGGLMDNLPLEFLVDDSAIAMDLHYMQPGAAIPADLTDYDLLFVAVGESDTNRPLLQQLAIQLQHAPIPVLNRPTQVMQTTREAAALALRGATGVMMPESIRINREELTSLAGENLVAHYLPDQNFPIIVRPVESHAGHGLARLDRPSDVATYLTEQQEELFYISQYVDYRSEDGQFRKYRVVLIDGEPYLAHLAISSHWIVHYLNADMVGDSVKCAEEARCMATFDNDFSRKHRKAFAAIHTALELDYLIIDCAEMHGGQLLVFEVDTSAIVHDMDPVDIFPYKQPQMHKIFSAFQAMLMRRGAA